MLIAVAFLPIPIGYIHSLLLERLGQSPADAEVGYMPCATTDLTPLDTLPPRPQEATPVHFPLCFWKTKTLICRTATLNTTNQVVYKKKLRHNLRRIYLNQDHFIGMLCCWEQLFVSVHTGSKITVFKVFIPKKKIVINFTLNITDSHLELFSRMCRLLFSIYNSR